MSERTSGTVEKPADYDAALQEIERLRNELAEKWELWQSCSGAEVYAELTPRIDKLYMQLNANARGDENDVEGDPVKPWNNLVALTATAAVRWIAANRWAVNEHQRCEKVDAELAEAHAEIDRLRTELDEAQLRSIEARNPGIDMDEVRRVRGVAAASLVDGQPATEPRPDNAALREAISERLRIALVTTTAYQIPPDWAAAVVEMQTNGIMAVLDASGQEASK